MQSQILIKCHKSSEFESDVTDWISFSINKEKSTEKIELGIPELNEIKSAYCLLQIIHFDRKQF